MLFKGSKSTQVLLTKQGYIQYANTQYILHNIAELFNFMSGEWGAGLKYTFRRTTECTVASEITQN